MFSDSSSTEVKNFENKNIPWLYWYEHPEELLGETFDQISSCFKRLLNNERWMKEVGAEENDAKNITSLVLKFCATGKLEAPYIEVFYYSNLQTF